jgi:hypothetical protein
MDYEEPKLINLSELSDLAQGAACAPFGSGQAAQGCTTGHKATGNGCSQGDYANQCANGVGV